MPVYVKMVHNVTAAWGNDSACVVDQPKQWFFDGDGLVPGGDTDLIKFVISETDCDSGSDVPLTGADFGGVAMYLSSFGNATFTIQSAAAGQFVNLCYKFGNENFMWYDAQAYIHMLQSVASLVGGKDIAVADVQEVLLVHANGSSSHDYVRWIQSGDASDSACNETIAIRDSADEGANEVIDIPVDTQGGEFLVNFTFESSSAGLAPTLCYKFAGEGIRTVLYTMAMYLKGIPWSRVLRVLPLCSKDCAGLLQHNGTRLIVDLPPQPPLVTYVLQ